MVYHMVIYFMISKSKDVLCGVIGGIVNTFWKECCSCVQRKFVFVQEWKR